LPRDAVFLSIDLDRQPSLRSHRPPNVSRTGILP
jgi:hypothetical protein